MGIRFTCPNGHKLNVKPFLAGKRAVCPKCGAKMRVPLESQTGTANSEQGANFGDPRHDGFGPQGSAGRQNSANHYNSVGPHQNGEPDFGMFVPDGEEDDVLWTEDAAAESGPADAVLHEAAFIDNPLDDPRANAALADAALSDPALGDTSLADTGQGHRGRGDAPPAHPPRSAAPASTPPPLRPPVARPAAPNPVAGGAGQPVKRTLRPKPVLHPMSGPAVDEVIAAASNAPRPVPPPPPQPEDDPIVRFRLQLKRRNRIMMIVSGALAVVVLILLVVLIMVLTGQKAPESTDQPAAAGTGPATAAPLEPSPERERPFGQPAAH
ncbi:MAG TPA: hypothetical protein VHY91_16055 [Pirellulales bacterium]|jgi:hypothetical protein|nr:hypothetical protein [Pirellulales bacterium]